MATWPTLTAEDVLSGEGAKTFALSLFDRDTVVFEKRTTWTHGNANTVNVAATSVATDRIRIPSGLDIGDTIRLDCAIYNIAGETTYVRLDESDTATTGTLAQATGSGISWVVTYLTEPDGSWAGTFKTLDLQLWTTAGGTAYVRGAGVIANLWFQD